MSKEIERKFLVDKDKVEDQIVGKILGGVPPRYPDMNITQWYFTDNIRIRQISKRTERPFKFFLTMKTDAPVCGITRTEIEQEISRDFYYFMFDLDVPKIDKSRYILDNGWVLDKIYFKNPENPIYDGTVLYLAEIELELEDQEIFFPEWIKEEVTNDKRYYNSYLAKYPYPYKEWRKRWKDKN